MEAGTLELERIIMRLEGLLLRLRKYMRQLQGEPQDQLPYPESPSEMERQVQAVYGNYCRIMRRSPERYKLTQGRAKKIAARLKEGFTVEQLVQAARNMALSDFHMGKNEAGRKYNDLAEHLYKSYEKTEAWVEGRPVEKRLEGEAKRRKEEEWAREQATKRRREREEFLRERAQEDPAKHEKIMDEIARKLGVMRKGKDTGNDTDKR